MKLTVLLCVLRLLVRKYTMRFGQFQLSLFGVTVIEVE